MSAPTSSSRTFAAGMPLLFVLLWSTGFLGAKLGLPYAEPFTFLSIRMAIAAGLLYLFAMLTRAPWPTRGLDYLHIMLAGLLVHAVYLGGVFSAIQSGLSSGVTALIVGVQPILTAVIAISLLNEKLSKTQWGGFFLGLIGVAMVVGSRLTLNLGNGYGILWSVLALLGVTIGAIYQKHFCSHMDLRSGGVIQYSATAIVLGSLAFALETREVHWTGEFVFALVWLILVLSVGAVGLLYTLIRLGSASKVASLFYAVPPTTALLAYFLFDEQLSAISMVGMVVTALGVLLVNLKPRRR